MKRKKRTKQGLPRSNQRKKKEKKKDKRQTRIQPFDNRHPPNPMETRTRGEPPRRARARVHVFLLWAFRRSPSTLTNVTRTSPVMVSPCGVMWINPGFDLAEGK